MNQQLFQIALVVCDYDEAIEYYTQKLNFDLVENTQLSETKRWVVVAPKGIGGYQLLLAKASGEEQESSIGNQTGGHVFLFLCKDDLDRDHKNLVKNEVKTVGGPILEAYGQVLVFADLYCNLWDLIEPK